MTAEDEDDIAGLRLVGRAVADARDAVLAAAEPGISTAELDEVARGVLDDHGAVSAPMLAYDFPGHTCLSVNDAAAHGIPSRDVILKDGDVFNVDVSAELHGYWGDTGASMAVGTSTPLIDKLLEATELAQRDAMAVAKAGEPINVMGRAVERRARQFGFKIIQNLNGHGVGRFIHEPPDVPSIYEPLNKTVLTEGLVIAVEPFLSPSGTYAVEDDDGWTLRTNDASIVAQFEHTMVVTNGEPIVLTESKG